MVALDWTEFQYVHNSMSISESAHKSRLHSILTVSLFVYAPECPL